MDVREQIVIAAEQQLAAGARDRDADLVGKPEPASALPMFLGDEHLDELAQLLAFGRVEQRVRRDVAFEDRGPLRRKRLSSEMRAPAFGEPTHINRGCIA